jgi:CheY-like chemotaxis protein
MGVCTVLQKPISIKALNEQISIALQTEAVAFESDVLDELEQLEREFKKELPLRISKLLDAVSRTSKNTEDLSLLKYAINQAHMLRGTAGMYGMARFGIAIGKIENMLLVMQKANCEGTCYADSWRSIEKAIEDLLQAVSDESQEYSAVSLQYCERRRHILVLDTDNAYSQRISNLLSSEGHLVFNFRDSLHLGEIIFHMKPDLIIVSNELQGDASDFVREWRTDIHLLDTPIAVVMKNAEPKIQEEYLSAGANIVISKSIPNLDFLAKVKSLLKIGGEMVPVQAGELRVA